MRTLGRRIDFAAGEMCGANGVLEPHVGADIIRPSGAGDAWRADDIRPYKGVPRSRRACRAGRPRPAVHGEWAPSGNGAPGRRALHPTFPAGVKAPSKREL